MEDIEEYKHKIRQRLQSFRPILEKAVPQNDKQRVMEFFLDIESLLNTLSNFSQKLKEKTTVLEKSKEQISGGWLQVEREKTRITAALDSLPLAFVMIDDQNKVLRANPAAFELLGFPKGEEINLKMVQEKVGASFNILDLAAKCFSKRGTFGPFDVAYGAKFLRFFLSAVIILKESLAVIGTVILVEDITLSNRSKDEFFAVAAHELRSPLTAIKLNVETLLQDYADKLTDETVINTVVQIDKDVIRLIETVHDFIDVSKLEEGKIPFKKQAFSIEEVIAEVIADLKNMASSRGLELQFKSGEATPKAYADPARIRQVLFNLLGNSIKFTDRGKIAVSLEKQGGFLKVRVTDTGHGVPLEVQPRLFEKFMKAGEGSGIGLYISKLLTEDMGGKIFLEKTDPGAGSTFAFTVPLAQFKT